MLQANKRMRGGQRRRLSSGQVSTVGVIVTCVTRTVPARLLLEKAGCLAAEY